MRGCRGLAPELRRTCASDAHLRVVGVHKVRLTAASRCPARAARTGAGPVRRGRGRRVAMTTNGLLLRRHAHELHRRVSTG
jgi:molybdenum cofactor biosynthesis enzyme MoaA